MVKRFTELRLSALILITLFSLYKGVALLRRR